MVDTAPPLPKKHIHMVSRSKYPDRAVNKINTLIELSSHYNNFTILWIQIPENRKKKLPVSI